MTLQQDDLLASRKYYEKVLEISREVGQPATADSKTTLAGLSIEEGHLAEVEVPLREALADYRHDGRNSQAAYAAAELSMSLRLQGRVADAAKEIAAGSHLVVNDPDVDSRLNFATEAARVKAALGKTAEAKKELEAVRAEAHQLGFLGDELDARLALGEIETKAGQKVADRIHLQDLERDARAKGFGLIARKAASARAGS